MDTDNQYQFVVDEIEAGERIDRYLAMKIDEVNQLLERYRKTKDSTPILELLRQHNVLKEDAESHPTVLMDATLPREMDKDAEAQRESEKIRDDTLSFSTMPKMMSLQQQTIELTDMIPERKSADHE